MQHVSVPLAFLYHDINNAVQCKLTVSVPKYNLNKDFVFNTIPQDIFDQTSTKPQDQIEFDVHPGKAPYVINFVFEGVDEYLTCVLFHPIVDARFDNTYYTDKSVENAPVRTISLKHNDVEIAKNIPGLDQRYNFKSWVNPHLKSGDKLRFRLFMDLRHFHTKHMVP